MGILLDVILIAILVLNVIIGYKKGLINVIFNVFAFFGAIILTLFLFKPISNLVIENTRIDDKIKEAIITNVQNKEKKPEEDQGSNSNGFQQYIEAKIKETTDNKKNTAIETVAENVAKRGTEVLTGIGLFIIFRIVLILLKFLSESLEELPIVKQSNELGGILYGALKAAVIILLLITILYFVVSIKPDGTISSAIEESYITRFLYENNILIKYCLLGKNLL